jgi:hypothetical protein
MKRETPQQYKGFTLNYINGQWRADAYASPQITNTNLRELKKTINRYLNKWRM